MKKLIVFVLLAWWASLVFAQDKDSIMNERKNVVKFLPVNIPFHSISFEYERMINDKNSLTLGVGLPNQKSIDGKYGLDANSDFKNVEFGTMHLRAAYRHYTGEGMLPKGFYIEPYLKYQHIKGASDISGIDDQTNVSYSGGLDVKLNSINLGFQLGTQFLIAKRITLDLYFLGLEAGFLSGNITGTAPNPQSANIIKTKIQENVSNLPSFIGNKVEITQSGNQVNAKISNVLYPWIRGGVSIGFAF
jgi:hypothetical protein